MADKRFSAALLVVAALASVSCSSDRSYGGRGGGRSMMAGRGFTPATGPKADPAALFLAGLDTNLDGVTTRQELTDALPKLWASADTDGGGSLSIIELNNWREHWLGSSDGWPGRFHFDTDGDGIITRKEFEAGLYGVFDAYDPKRTGQITRVELLTAQGPAPRPEGANGESDDQQGGGGGGRRGPGRRRGPGGGEIGQ